MSAWGAITWDVARTGGFVAHGLVTLSIALGLVLSLRWRAPAWPRWATNDLHRYLTLLALIFTGIHSLAVWLDPFMAFGPGEVFVPLLSHYRPVWMALGIVAAYLMLAIWLSERVQRRIGYAWWRRLHYLTFAIYALVTIHGIGMGSDTRTQWAVGIYAGSFVLVGSLLAVRLLLPGPHLKARPGVAAGVAVAAVLVAGWMVSGPLRPGWNAVANNGNGSGARVALAEGASPVASAVQLPFSASLNGTATQVGGQGGFGSVTVRVDSTLSGRVQGSLTILLEGMSGANGGLAVQRTDVIFTPAASSESFEGQITSMQGNRLSALCTGPAGGRIRLDVQLQVDDSGNVSGTVRGSQA